ncbi:WXG100 family type VII secretion target [Mycobacterium sp. DL592]|uniref:WXG100 family type VII secretion target n=1 Tax=Mycobacterium sp. DL592 TaxID=2675524 RepID=UPI00141FEC0F|nr:WXG100 family type VII secretion target [Mycobacterium sp. DL592]
MADDLKVDVEGLVRGGSDIDEQAAALSASHRRSMVDLSDSESGWVGSSADALVRMAATWQQVADAHHTALTEQSTHVADAARVFQAVEERSASELEQVAHQEDSLSWNAIRELCARSDPARSDLLRQLSKSIGTNAASNATTPKHA